MKPEYIEYALYVLYAYFLIGFLLWLWALADDAKTGNRHRGGFTVALAALAALVLSWPFLVRALCKPRGRK